jgi:hypothetical protein
MRAASREREIWHIQYKLTPLYQDENTNKLGPLRLGPSLRGGMPRPICLLRLSLGKLLSVLAVCLWSLSVASAQQVTHIDLLAEQVTIPRRAKPLTIVNHIEPLTHSCTHTHTQTVTLAHTHTHTLTNTHTHTHTPGDRFGLATTHRRVCIRRHAVWKGVCEWVWVSEWVCASLSLSLSVCVRV